MRRLGRVAAIVLGLLVAGLAAAWLVFVPFEKGPRYEFVAAWGVPGDGPGEFDDPTGIAVAGGEVFVADSRNGRVQVFDREGNFRRQFGRPGEARGELGRPMNLTIDGDRLYVAEYFNDRVQVFRLDGTPLAVIGSAGSGEGRFSAPGGAAVAANGELLVADFYNHRVQRLGPDGGFVGQWGTTGDSGFWAGEFLYPTDVAVGADGTVFVADGYNDRIQAFGSDGRFLRKWGGPFAMNVFGPFNGWFATVTGVTVGPENRVFVADFYNDRVQVFRPDGTFLTDFGGRGEGAGEFRHAVAVDVAADGTVFVADFLNDRVQAWRPAE